MHASDSRRFRVMNGKQVTKSVSALIALAWIFFLMTACRKDVTLNAPAPQAEVTFKPQEMADALHAVIAADREVYAVHILQRLAADEKVLQASSAWKENKALPLPAQVLR